MAENPVESLGRTPLSNDEAAQWLLAVRGGMPPADEVSGAEVSATAIGGTVDADHSLLDAAVAAMTEGLGVLERVDSGDGTVDFRWYHVNAAYLALTAETGVVGRLVVRDRAGGGAEADLCGLLTAVSQGSGNAMERILAMRTGHRRVSARGFTHGGKSFVSVTVSDLTEQDRRLRDSEAEAQLAKQAAEKAARAKSEFLTHMSHELRTPLNAIIGFADLIVMETFGTLGNPRYRVYARDILDSGRHLLELVDDALDIARIDAGRLNMVEEMIQLSVEIWEAADQYLEAASARNVAVTRDTPADLPLLIADRRAVRQMLLHLISNAVKFTPEGGDVLVSASTTPDGGIGLMVADTGIGIADADMEMVLKPFGRTEMSVPHHIDGTGLGLPIVQRLIDMHGGRLEMMSEPGVGTTVILNFPAQRVVRPQMVAEQIRHERRE